jgi:hypothetical protein
MNQGVFVGRRGIRPKFIAPAKITGWQLAMEHPGVPFVEPVFATIKGQAQRFLSTHAAVSNSFNLGRHMVSAGHYRILRVGAFGDWAAAVV